MYAGIGRPFEMDQELFWAYLCCWHLFLAFDTLTALLQVQRTCIQDRYSHILHHCSHCRPHMPEKLHKLPMLTFAVVGDRPFMSQLSLCWVMTLYSFFSSSLHIREISDPYSYLNPPHDILYKLELLHINHSVQISVPPTTLLSAHRIFS